MSPKTYAAGALAAAGGLLMLASGYASRGFLFSALGYAAPRLSDYLSGDFASLALLAITLVELVIGLGGLTVLAGGILILAKHATIGRTLVWLGGASGFLGLVVGFGYAIFRLGGLEPTLAYLPYWIGVAMAILGRRLARGR